MRKTRRILRILWRWCYHAYWMSYLDANTHPERLRFHELGERVTQRDLFNELDTITHERLWAIIFWSVTTLAAIEFTMEATLYRIVRRKEFTQTDPSEE